jgi:hypothetical protein
MISVDNVCRRRLDDSLTVREILIFDSMYGKSLARSDDERVLYFPLCNSTLGTSAAE